MGRLKDNHGGRGPEEDRGFRAVFERLNDGISGSVAVV